MSSSSSPSNGEFEISSISNYIQPPQIIIQEPSIAEDSVFEANLSSNENKTEMKKKKKEKKEKKEDVSVESMYDFYMYPYFDGVSTDAKPMSRFSKACIGIFILFVIGALGTAVGLAISLSLGEENCVKECTNSGFCYCIMTRDKTWHEAKNACLAFNATLLIPNTAIKYDFLASVSKLQAWIGAYTLSENDKMYWLDGTIATNLTLFSQSSVLPTMKCAYARNCFGFCNQLKFQLKFDDCDAKLNFICEFPMQNS